jgi:transposase
MIFIGDDWAEDHHDVYLMDEAGRRLASRRLPEGLTGIRQLHELVAAHAEEPEQAVIGIETDRGLWVGALTAAGYQVYAINPLAVPHTATVTTSRAHPMRLMQSCWPIWSAPTGTTTARSLATAPMRKRSRCSPGRIRT